MTQSVVSFDAYLPAPFQRRNTKSHFRLCRILRYNKTKFQTALLKSAVFFKLLS